MLDPNAFRQKYPEFSDPSVYADDFVNLWAGVAVNLINADRWGALTDYGTELFVAHHLVLGVRDQDAAELSNEPGKVQGVLISKAVDKVSASYDAKAVTSENADFWNMTVYGIRFYRLSRMMGAGGLVVQ